MAKKPKFKYKDVKINKEPLTITKIGEITPVAQNPFAVFFIFVILLVFIFFLPNIVNYLQGKTEEIDNSIFFPLTSKPKPEDTEPKEDLKFYDFTPTLVVDLDNAIKIDKFTLIGNTLSFTITNSSATKYYFNKHNYFLEVYSTDNMLLERLILQKDGIPKESSLDFNYELKQSTAANLKKLVFVEKEIADYPNITLTKNESNEEVLICTKNYQISTYKFQEGKLTTINEVINYPKHLNDANYEPNLNAWQTKSNKLSTIPGITSTFINSGNSFVVSTVINTKDAKITDLEDENYYAYDTLAKVIKFEMDARGFNCK